MGGSRRQHFALLLLAMSTHSSFCFNETTNPTIRDDIRQNNNTTDVQNPTWAHTITLIVIYTLVFTVGSVGVTMMIGVLKSNLRSWTAIAFFNLIIIHVIFLATVPFRIYYYAGNSWNLSMTACKLVSSMIHIHMHVVFVIYVIILTIHFLHYFKKKEQTEIYRGIHAIGLSAGIWSIVIIAGPAVLYHYGANTNDTHNKCFDFGSEIKEAVLSCNIFLSVSTVIVSCLMSCILAVILYLMIKKHGASSWAQQEFWAQMKNVSLVFIILICLVPYHLYRLYYLTKLPTELKYDNEVFLAITSLTCFDMMIVFAGKGICQRCGG